MSLKIDQGLFNLDFTDYHAILGVGVDADLKEIRKRYLAVARRLHPDSYVAENETDRKSAAELLSKLVNPAYEKLSQEKNHTEYCILLRLKGQQALKQQETVVLTSDQARHLAAAPDIDVAYRTALKELSERQYQQINRALEIAGQISELNLVYLMRKESRGEAVGIRRTLSPEPATPPSPTVPRSPTVSAPPQRVPATREAIVAAYLRRAQEFEMKQNFPRAILELRDAIKMDPTNSNCHSRLGMVYLKTNQNTMAKIHFNKALELNPQDAVALEGKSRLEPSSSTATVGKPDAKDKPDAKGKPGSGKSVVKGSKPDDKGNSGGLFGLFGSKKK
ncbi:MAG: J domain-containing protein [Leptolyngbyaceae cyanobacterium CRU_2_3]|nr:J domain-containing protein [Leptolyngbyaceae cyanobacterium CRU_2_3]